MDRNPKIDIVNKPVYTKKRISNFLIALAIASSVFFVYFNTLSNQFVWDDHCLIEDNIFIKNWNHIVKIFTTHLFYGGGGTGNFYRPLQSLTLMFDYSIWKLNPFGYHFTNVILHILTAIVVYFLLLAITSEQKISLFTSLIFAIHPIHTEAISYISGRADMLSSLFLLLSFLVFVGYEDNQRFSSYIGSLFLFILALLSKENTLIFPLLLLVYVYLFSNTKKKSFSNLWVFFIVAVIYIVIRLTLLNFNGIFFQGHKVPLLNPLLNRLLTTTKAIFIYVGLLIFPHNLHMERGMTLSSHIFEPASLLSLISLIGILIVSFKVQKKSKIIFFATLWFFINLIPYSNITPLNARIAEHWVYLSSIGFFLIIVILILKVFKHMAPFIFSGMLVMYSFGTIIQNRFWSNELTLYHRILKLNPYSVRTHFNLGKVYNALGRYDEAITAFNNALRLNPNVPDIYNDLGFAYFNKNEIVLAVDQYKKTLTFKPDYFRARYNLGRAYERLGELDKAKNEYLETIRLNPNYAKAYASLANLYQQLKSHEDAIKNYEHALGLDPNLREVYINLGASYEELGNLDKAREIYKKGLDAYPDSAELNYNLGLAYKKQGLYDNAIKEYQTAIKLKPDYAEAYGNLGVVYAKKGMIENAKKSIEKSLEIDPNNEAMKQNLEKLSGQKL